MPDVDVRPNAGIVRSPIDEIKAIQNLLADVYKDAGDGRTLFRELVQNADDAGATRLELVVLERGWPHAHNTLLRGPALLVANDGGFPKRDGAALHTLMLDHRHSSGSLKYRYRSALYVYGSRASPGISSRGRSGPYSARRRPARPGEPACRRTSLDPARRRRRPSSAGACPSGCRRGLRSS